MIARGGMPIVVLPAMAAALLLVSALATSSNFPIILTLPFGALFVVFLVFFRDPDRSVGNGLTSPADGRVIAADPERGAVSIYMSFLDVHVNRAPWTALVVSRRKRAGGHSLAGSPAAVSNYSVYWELGTLIGKIEMRQIAGMFARRIVPYVDEGARIKKGQKIGLIRFGSRVELMLPPTVRLVVAVGDRVRAGETTIAEVVHDVAQENQPG